MNSKPLSQNPYMLVSVNSLAVIFFTLGAFMGGIMAALLHTLWGVAVMIKTTATPFKHRVDVGLSVLCAVSKQDENLSCAAIADVCDCSIQYIREVELRAVRKMRALMDRDDYTEQRHHG